MKKDVMDASLMNKSGKFLFFGSDSKKTKPIVVKKKLKKKLNGELKKVESKVVNKKVKSRIDKKLEKINMKIKEKESALKTSKVVEVETFKVVKLPIKGLKKAVVGKKGKKVSVSEKGKSLPKEDDKWLKTYVPGFDNLIRSGGLPRGSAILVEGGPGSGKTIFCLSLLKQMCERGKKVLYMSFEEREERLRGYIKTFGGDPEKYEKAGNLYIKRFNALDIARSVEALLSEAKKELLIEVQPVLIPKDFQPDIVLIDSLTSIGSAFSGEESRFRVYMEQLFRYLEGHDITSFLIREVSSPSHVGNNFQEKGDAVSFLSDGIIAIYNIFYDEGHRKRGMEIIKMRGTDIDRRIVEIDIQGKHGFVVYPNKAIKGKYKLT